MNTETQQTKLDRIAKCEWNIEDYKSMIHTNKFLQNQNHDLWGCIIDEDEDSYLTLEISRANEEIAYWQAELVKANTEETTGDNDSMNEQTKAERITECQENIAHLNANYVIFYDRAEVSNDKHVIWAMDQEMKSASYVINHWHKELEKAQAMDTPQVEISEAIMNFHYESFGAHRSWAWSDFIANFNEYWMEDMVYMPIDRSQMSDAETFLQEAMFNVLSEDRYKIYTDNYHQEVCIELLTSDETLAITLTLQPLGNILTRVHIVLADIALLQEFAELLTLAASIAQKWQEKCEDKS